MRSLGPRHFSILCDISRTLEVSAESFVAHIKIMVTGLMHSVRWRFGSDLLTVSHHKLMYKI